MTYPNSPQYNGPRGGTPYPPQQHPPQQQPPYGYPPQMAPYGFPPPQPPQKSRKKLVWILLGVGALLVVLVCGGVIGVVKFGFNIIEAEIRNQVRDEPVLIEHIGQIEKMDVDLTESAALNDDDTFVYHVTGSKGSGVLTVKHVTNDAGDEEIQSADLRLPDGRVVKVK
jgi:hypothetical protein